MKHIRIFSYFSATIATLTLLFGVGLGHSVVSSFSMLNVQGEARTQCQTICLPMVNEKLGAPQVDEDDADPDPLPFQPLDTAPYATYTYAVALGALVLLFLRRRPPDLVVLYANYRF